MAASPEQRKQYQVVKSFKALNTKNNRTALDDAEFSWLENVQPIGFGNLKVVNAQGNSTATFSNTVTTLTNFNVNNTDYIAAFETNGKAEVYNVTSNSVSTLANASTFSAAGVRARQWKDERAIIIDPDKGYKTWDGTNLVTVGCIGPIGITNAGTNYTTVPTITISAPNETGGQQATAVAAISNAAGTVISAQVTNTGSGYTSIPTVTIAAPASSYGVQAQGSAVLSGGNVVAISITNPGSGYTSAPSITITGGGGTNAAATAVLGSGLVSAITITNPGSGYTATPTVTISGGGGNNATAVAGFLTFATGAIGVVVNTGGSGYTSTPTVNISAAPVGGTNAAATAIVNGGVVTNIIVTNPGAGYTSTPSVTITGGGGNGATATAVLTSNQNVDIASFQGRVAIEYTEMCILCNGIIQENTGSTNRFVSFHRISI